MLHDADRNRKYEEAITNVSRQESRLDPSTTSRLLGSAAESLPLKRLHMEHSHVEMELTLGTAIMVQDVTRFQVIVLRHTKHAQYRMFHHVATHGGVHDG